MQLLADKVLWQKRLQPVPSALALQCDARHGRRAVDVDMYPVRQPPAPGRPPHREHTALVHSILQRLRRRQRAPRELQAAIVNGSRISRFSRISRISSISRFSRFSRFSRKTLLVDFQERIPLGNLPVGGRLPQPHAQHRRGRRGELDHRLEARPLLQLRR